MRKLTIVAALCLLVPAVSQAKSLEDLLVEKGVISKSEARASMHGSDAKVYWNNGTRLEFPDQGFTTSIKTLIQPRYTLTDGDSDAGASNTSSFDLQRARIIISGTALNNEFSYHIEHDLVETEADTEATKSEGTNSPELKDAYITWHACDWVSMTAGQYRVPLSRQFVTNPNDLQFADRSEVSTYFDVGRHQGTHATIDLADGKGVLMAGIWNGISDMEGINQPGRDTRHVGAVVLRGNLMGEMNPYVEGDIEYTEDAAVNVGAVYAYGQSNTTVTVPGEELDFNSFNFDANLKSNGFSLHGEFYWQNLESDTTAFEDESTGFYVQGGYFVKPKRMEVALRGGMISCEDAGGALGICAGNEDVQIASASLNYYWWKHHLKAQLGYEYLNEEPAGAGDDETTSRWLLQLTSYF